MCDYPLMASGISCFVVKQFSNVDSDVTSKLTSIQLADDAFAVQLCRSPETVSPSPPLMHTIGQTMHGFLTLQHVLNYVYLLTILYVLAYAVHPSLTGKFNAKYLCNTF